MGNHKENEKIINGPIMVIARILKMVVASAAEVEVGALYHTAREIYPLCMEEIELVHPQPATPIQTNNSAASCIMNGTIKQCQSKAIDMCLYWLKDRVSQNMFKVYWAPGKVNLADYFSKHHPATYVKNFR